MSRPAPVLRAAHPNQSGHHLAAHDYVEQEWFVEGRADAFDPDGRCIARDAPYATRFVVRRPVDGTCSSGTVLLDPLHMIGEMPATWDAADWIMASGHTWVGVTVHNSSFGARYGFVGGIDALKERDPERYGVLHLAAFERPPPLRSYPGPSATDSFALRWHMAMAHPQGHPVVVDVARELRSADAFADLRVQRIYGCGVSQTSNFWRGFLDGGWHDRGRLDEAPPFDAYVLLVSPAPSYRPVDAVLVNVLSEAEVVGTIVQTPAVAPADCDQPRVRGIELAGAPHTIGGAVVQQPDAEHRHTSEPYFAFVTAQLAALDRWVREDVPMPHVPPIARDASRIDGIVRDQWGNAVGGLRAPWLEAPRAQYLPRCACGPTLGEVVPFGPDRLAGLYRDRADFERRWRRAVQRLVEDRLLVPEDAARFAQPPAEPGLVSGASTPSSQPEVNPPTSA